MLSPTAPNTPLYNVDMPLLTKHPAVLCLSQGISNGVGLAMAQAHLGATFNREGFSVIDNYTFVICGDGCMQVRFARRTPSCISQDSSNGVSVDFQCAGVFLPVVFPG